MVNQSSQLYNESTGGQKVAKDTTDHRTLKRLQNQILISFILHPHLTLATGSFSKGVDGYLRKKTPPPQFTVENPRANQFMF